MRWLDGITDSMDVIEQAPGDGEGQGSLACCSPWSHKESDTTERLNNNSNIQPGLKSQSMCLSLSWTRHTCVDLGPVVTRLGFGL